MFFSLGVCLYRILKSTFFFKCCFVLVQLRSLGFILIRLIHSDQLVRFQLGTLGNNSGESLTVASTVVVVL